MVLYILSACHLFRRLSASRSPARVPSQPRTSCRAEGLRGSVRGCGGSWLGAPGQVPQPWGGRSEAPKGAAEPTHGGRRGEGCASAPPPERRHRRGTAKLLRKCKSFAPVGLRLCANLSPVKDLRVLQSEHMFIEQ